MNDRGGRLDLRQVHDREVVVVTPLGGDLHPRMDDHPAIGLGLVTGDALRFSTPAFLDSPAQLGEERLDDGSDVLTVVGSPRRCR